MPNNSIGLTDVLELLFERHPVVRLALLADEGVSVLGAVAHQVLHQLVHVASVLGQNGAGKGRAGCARWGDWNENGPYNR